MKKVMIPCSCGCSIVTIVEFEEWKDDPREIYAEFYTQAQPGRWERLKTAWKVFRRKDHFLYDLSLDEKGLKELQTYLNEVFKEDNETNTRPVRKIALDPDRERIGPQV